VKILIAGAGIAGLTLAHCLERHGHHPVLVERSPGLRDGGYMLDFSGPGYDVAEKLGLLPELEAFHDDIPRMTFVDPGGKPRFSVRTAALRKLLDDRIVNVLRGDLERLLYTKIKDRVEIRFGTEVESCAQDGQGVRATFSDGQTGEHDLLVGADGVHSRVRAMTFGPEKQFARFVGYYAAAFILDDPTLLGAAADAFYTLSEPRRQINVYPIPGGGLATLFIHRAERDLASFTSESIRRELHAAYDGIGWIVPELLARSDLAAEVYFDRTEQIELPRWSDGRVALVGDAAGCVSLLAGQGASLAMAGAYVLADELAAAGGDLAGALARYEARVKPAVVKSQRAGRSFARWFVPDNRARIALRDLVMRLANWPVAAPLLKQSFAFGSTIKF